MPHNPTLLLAATKAASLLLKFLTNKEDQMIEIDGPKTMMEILKEVKDSLKVPPTQPISSKIRIRLEAVSIASFLQLQPMERMALKKKECKTTADKAMIGLMIEMMAHSPTVRIDQVEEAMMTRTMKTEEAAKISTKTEEEILMKMKIEMRSNATPETRTTEVTMMKMIEMMSQEAGDRPRGNMTMKKKMRIDSGLVEEIKEMTMKKEAVVPAVDTMMMKRKSQGRGPLEDMRAIMRKIPAIIDHAVDTKAAETMTAARVADRMAAAVAQAGNTPTSDIMIESNNLTYYLHLKIPHQHICSSILITESRYC